MSHFQHKKSFTSLAKPCYPNYNKKDCIFSCSQRNPHFYSCQSHHTFSGKVHGFMSNPLLHKQFMSTLSNARFRILSKKFEVGLLSNRFGTGSFRFSSSFGSNGRSGKPWFYRLSPNDMVVGLISANAAVFILWRIADKKFMIKNFTISRTFGPEYLLKLYLAGAIGGSLFSLVHMAFLALSTKGQRILNDPSTIPGLGASGAVNAIMLLEIFLHPRARLPGIFLIGIDVLQMIQRNNHVSGSGQLGGAAVAAIAYFWIKKGRF